MWVFLIGLIIVAPSATPGMLVQMNWANISSVISS